MEHRDSIERYSGGLSELVEDVGNLKDDALAEFLRLLAAKVERDGSRDAARERVQLASALQECASHLGASAAGAGEAWRVAKSFMSDAPNDK